MLCNNSTLARLARSVDPEEFVCRDERLNMTCHRIGLYPIAIHKYFRGLAETHAIGDETKWLVDLSVRLNFVASTAFRFGLSVTLSVIPM